VARDLTANPLSILLRSWPAEFNRFLFRDIVVNIALYLPAGVTGHLAFRKFGKTWLSISAPILICTMVSASVETIQLFVPPRDTSLLDLATNVTGSVLGVFLGVTIEDVFLRNRALTAARKIRKPARPPDRVALVLLGCWLIWLWFPLFPILGRTTLANKLSIFFHSPLLDLIPFLSAAVAWFAAGNFFWAGAVRPARRWTAISTGLIPTQLFILDRQPVTAELTGAVVGATCFIFLWSMRRTYKNAWWKITAWAFLATIVVRGLAPFRFFAAATTSFSWIPFSGFLTMNWQTGVQVIAEKSFWYGSAIWLLRASGMSVLKATALVAATLLGIEIAQTHLTGRVAEITDPLWGIFAGCAIVILGRPRQEQGVA